MADNPAVSMPKNFHDRLNGAVFAVVRDKLHLPIFDMLHGGLDSEIYNAIPGGYVAILELHICTCIYHRRAKGARRELY